MTGSIDPGLIVIQGQLNGGVTIEKGEERLNAILEEIMQDGVPEPELNKVKNQAESTLVFSEVEMLNRAMNLAFYANTGDPEGVNQEGEKLQAITADEIKTAARQLLRRENTSTLYYRAKK
jgi:predicted Zn-dependent peptidase